MKQVELKHVWMAFCALLVTATFVNCGKKDDGPNAAPSMAASCYNLQTSSANSNNRSVCNYNYAAFSGFTTYNSSSSSSYTNNWWGGTTTGNSLNGCSSYQVMTYSPTKGLGCVDNGRLQYNGIPARYRLNTYSNSFDLMTASAAVAGSGYGYGTSSYNYQDQYQNQNQNQQYATGSDVLRVCDDAEPCPSGLACRSPLGNVPTMGVCYH